MTAPIGATVRLYVDLQTAVAIGDVIETTSGRRYSVLGVRVQQRGAAAGRQHLECIVIDPAAALPEIGTLHRLHRIRWYKRAAKRRR
jgi:hypothetical protein